MKANRKRNTVKKWIANEVMRPAHEVARRNIDNGVVLAWPSGLGDRRYPQEEDVNE
jgi:hypothetical protein